jgi:hypothetical protein
MKKSIFLIAALLVAPLSFAQVPIVAGPFSPFPPPYNPHVSSPITGAPPVVTAASGGGVVSAKSGTVAVATKAAEKIAIPTTVAATASRLAIAKAAARMIPLVGAAATLAEVAQMMPRYHLCPSGSVDVAAFFCRPASLQDAPAITGPGYDAPGFNAGPIKQFQDPVAGCAYGWAEIQRIYGARAHHQTPVQYQGRNDWLCAVYNDKNEWQSGIVHDVVYFASKTYCADGSTRDTTKPTSQQCRVNEPAEVKSVAQVETELERQMALDGARDKKLYDAMAKDMPNIPWRETNPIPYSVSSPVSVTTSPVTTPKRVVSTQTVPKSDGSVDTVTKEAQTTITPQTTGTTAGDVKTTYPATTVYTTTTVNNVTNETTINNETVNEEAEPEEKDPCKANPAMLGCAALGTPPNAEQIPTKEVAASYSMVSFASSASCPSAISINAPIIGSKAISWQPFCDVMGQLRPLFLACAALACAWIFARGVQSL